MALAWLTALKIIPWGDVVEHAPQLLNAARQLLGRQAAPAPAPQHELSGHSDGAEQPSLARLQTDLTALAQAHAQQAEALQALGLTVAELAQHNVRLVAAVEVLRVRSQVLLWACAVLGGGLLCALLWVGFAVRAA
jgi:hypothetical protein